MQLIPAQLIPARAIAVVGALAGLTWCAPARAHAGVWVTGPNELPFAWTLDPLTLLPLVLLWLLYGRGLARRPHLGGGRAVCFAAGMATMLLALVWPLDALGETLFSAHMAQHVVLTTVAPPLLLLGRPAGPVLAALPRSLRQPMARLVTDLRKGLELLLRPLPATVLHGAAVWLWHAPLAFDAALRDPALHRLEHLSFFATALLFWAMVLRSPRTGPLGPPAAAGGLLTTLMHSGLLGCLLAFAPDPLYPWYEDRTFAWGLTALEDQQLAGLIMWVPAGFAYIGAGLALMGVWLGRPDAKRGSEAEPRAGL